MSIPKTALLFIRVLIKDPPDSKPGLRKTGLFFMDTDLFV
jgi:hypothetical protein